MAKEVVLGEKAFAAITAVEGLALSDADQALITELRRQGRSNDEIRQIILAEFKTRKAA